MNVKQLIEKYKKLEGVWDAPGAETARRIFLLDLEQLDEPKKVKVPQFVSDWIKKCKTFEHLISLSFALNPISWEENRLSDECIDWLKSTSNQEVFARAWLDGYKIEKEKRYTVRIRSTKQPLFYNNMYEKIFFSMGDLATRFTRKQLEEAGLGWVFDCEGIEIEEVE